jgi:hypothetical protein
MKTGKPGDTVNPCDGTAAIAEARKWAKMWKARALRAGWTKGKKEDRAVAALWDVGANSRRAIERIASEMDERGDVSTARRLRSIASPLLELDEKVNPPVVPATPPPSGQPEDNSTGQALEDLGGALEAAGATLTLNGETIGKWKDHRAGECRGQTWFRCKLCNPKGSKSYRHCENGCDAPSTPDSDICLSCNDRIMVKHWGKPCRCEELDKAKRAPGSECSHCPRRKPAVTEQDWPEVADGLDRAMDAEIAKAEERKGYPGAAKLAEEHLEEALAAGKEIAYCQGKERHHCVVGSPMHEQMLERGCIQCGAYPEEVTIKKVELKNPDGDSAEEMPF